MYTAEDILYRNCERKVRARRRQHLWWRHQCRTEWL